MKHLDEGTIHAWLDGAVDDARSREIDAHVAACGECAERVAEARGLIAGASRILGALDDVPGGVLPAGSRAAPTTAAPVARPKRRWIAAPWVTGIAAVLVAAVVLRTGMEVRRSETAAAITARAALDTVRALSAPRGAVAGASAYEATPTAPAESMSTTASVPPAPRADARAREETVANQKTIALRQRREREDRAMDLAASPAQPAPPPPAAPRLEAVASKAAADEIVVTGMDVPASPEAQLAGCYVVSLSQAPQPLPPAEPARSLAAGRVAGGAVPTAAAARPSVAKRVGFSNASLLALTKARADSGGFVVRAVRGDTAVGTWRMVDSATAELRLESGVVVMVPRAIRAECPVP